MTNNVLILGAGFSHNAGIPLLSNFVERMLDYAWRGTVYGKALSEADRDILSTALEVRGELDGYHGRATFDDRNIEDILSILSFNVLGGGKSERKKLDAVTRAIARTIELSCKVTHTGLSSINRFTAINTGDESYRNFWLGLFKWIGTGNQLPTIITFNYDLVLERSLLQVLINTYFGGYDERAPFECMSINYGYDLLPTTLLKVANATYSMPNGDKSGTVLNYSKDKTGKYQEIEILKLHGSLNFPKNKTVAENKDTSYTAILDDPYILPPISNKFSSGHGDAIWRIALNRLRAAKNLIFVGYSLPRTDIYMQYFLKAALGPNSDLNKIFVFDPLLFTGGELANDMKKRYEDCLAEQLRSRIIFDMSQHIPRNTNIMPGKLEHFIYMLNESPAEIMF